MLSSEELTLEYSLQLRFTEIKQRDALNSFDHFIFPIFVIHLLLFSKNNAWLKELGKKSV